jgi:excisionase family DNA binding protein
MATHTTPHHLTGSGQRLPQLTQSPAPLGSSGRPDRLLSADDVAELLGVPRSFVYALARRGGIPAVRLGDRYVRFRAAAIEGWIAEQEHATRGRR